MMEDLLTARVGDIIATLRQVNRQHALVLKSRNRNTGGARPLLARRSACDWG